MNAKLSSFTSVTKPPAKYGNRTELPCVLLLHDNFRALDSSLTNTAQSKERYIFSEGSIQNQLL